MSDFEASDELGYSVKEYRALMREDELQAKRRKRQCERELAEIYGDEDESSKPGDIQTGLSAG